MTRYEPFNGRHTAAQAAHCTFPTGDHLGLPSIRSPVDEGGVVKVNLMVRHSNRAALGFYANLGYGDDDVTVLSRRLSESPQ